MPGVTRPSVTCLKFCSLLLPVYWMLGSELGEVDGERVQDFIDRLGLGERPGSVFQVAIPTSMSFSRTCTQVCTLRRVSLSMSRPDQRSTRFIHDESVGVMRTWKRGGGPARS